MDAPTMEYRQKLSQQIIKAFNKNRLEASFAPTKAQAREEVLGMIPAGSSVARAGSMSLVEMGLWEALRAKGAVVLDPFEPGIAPEEALARRYKGLAADFLLSSANAVTVDGKIVNLDGSGNRVAGMAFGPKKVILVVGMNKVAPDLEAAIKRVKEYAAPVNCVRLKRKTPCAETGICLDCKSPDRICNIWSIIEGNAFPGRIHVKLVGEDLGY